MRKTSADADTRDQARAHHRSAAVCGNFGRRLILYRWFKGEISVPRTTDWGLTKDIANGIALTSFFAISVTIPFLGALSVYALPLPVLFYRLKLGRKNSAIIPVAVLFIIGLIFGIRSFEMLFFLELLLVGFVLGELMELDLPIEKTVAYTCSAVIVSGIFLMLIYSNLTQTHIISTLSEFANKQIDMAVAMYRQIGMAEEDIQAFLKYRDIALYLLVRTLPFLAIASVMIVIWVNILMAKPLFALKGITYPDFGELKKWKAPEILVWGVIAGGILMFLQIKPLLAIGLNCLIVLMTIYFFQGIAIVSYTFEKKGFSRLLKFSFYSIGFIVLRQLLIIVVSGIGFFDTWVDFRKLETKMNNQEHG